MINWAQIQQLEEDIGAESFGEIVELFLAEVDEAVNALATAPPETPETLAPALHFLKGSAYNLGFQKFGDFCSEGEEVCRAGQAQQVDLGQVIQLYNDSKAFFLQEAPKHCSFKAPD